MFKFLKSFGKGSSLSAELMDSKSVKIPSIMIEKGVDGSINKGMVANVIMIRIMLNKIPEYEF